MKPCSKCKFAAICMAEGFTSFSARIIRALMADEDVVCNLNETGPGVIERRLQEHAERAVDTFTQHLPEDCPGNKPMKEASLRFFRTEFGDMEVELTIALPHPLKRIDLVLKA